MNNNKKRNDFHAVGILMLLLIFCGRFLLPVQAAEIGSYPLSTVTGGERNSFFLLVEVSEEDTLMPEVEALSADSGSTKEESGSGSSGTNSGSGNTGNTSGSGNKSSSASSKSASSTSSGSKSGGSSKSSKSSNVRSSGSSSSTGSKSPRTGDSMQLSLWAGIFLLAGICIGLLLFAGRSKTNRRDRI